MAQDDTHTPQETFLATASHEIRTPLNGILGTASLLLETQLTPAQREYAEAIRNSGARLLDLLNNVLDHARLDSGRVELETEDFCPVGLAREVVELLSPRAHAGGLDIASRALHLPAATRRGDAGRIRQILFNLVGNALKFTERGAVLLDIVPGGSSVTWRVRDTGPGIDASQRDALFDAFRQASAGDARKDGGVGLGLSIARRLTHLLEGEMRVTGAKGLGTCFEVEIPLERSDRAPAHDLPCLGSRVGLVGLPPATMLAAAASLVDASATPVCIDAQDDVAPGATCDALLVAAELPAASIRALAGLAPALVVLRPEDRGAIATFRELGCAGWLVRPLRASSLVERVWLARSGSAQEDSAPGPTGSGRVLIADDNPVNALIARRALESAGFTVTVAATGVEAIEAVDTVAPDLVFMDLRMPVMDGFEATRRLRENGIDVAIIAISAEINPQVEREARQAGANQVAAKPIDPETLRRLALRWTSPDKAAGAA